MEPQTRFWGFHFHQTAVSPKFFPHLSHLSSFLNATNSNISAFIAIWKLSSTTLMGDANFKTSPSSFFWRSRTWDFEFLDLLLGQLQDLHPTQFQPSACALDKVDAHLWNHLRGWTMQIGRSTCEKLVNHYGKIYCFKKRYKYLRSALTVTLTFHWDVLHMLQPIIWHSLPNRAAKSLNSPFFSAKAVFTTATGTLDWTASGSQGANWSN